MGSEKAEGEWRRIEGFPRYWVSRDGRVRKEGPRGFSYPGITKNTKMGIVRMVKADGEATQRGVRILVERAFKVPREGRAVLLLGPGGEVLKRYRTPTEATGDLHVSRNVIYGRCNGTTPVVKGPFRDTGSTWDVCYEDDQESARRALRRLGFRDGEWPEGWKGPGKRSEKPNS